MFNMVQHHKYNQKELEDMIPFERDLYIDMLLSYMQSIKDSQDS